MLLTITIIVIRRRRLIVFYGDGDCAATTAAVVDAEDGVFCDDDTVDCDYELNLVGHP